MSDHEAGSHRPIIDYLLDEVPLTLEWHQVRFLAAEVFTPAKLQCAVVGVTLQAIHARFVLARSACTTGEPTLALTLPRILAQQLAFWLSNAFASPWGPHSPSPLAVAPHFLVTAQALGAALDQQMYPKHALGSSTWLAAIELAEHRVLAVKVHPPDADG